MKEGEYGQGKQEERSGRVIASRPDSLVTVVIVGSFITATSIVVDYNIKLFNTNVLSVTVTVNYIHNEPTHQRLCSPCKHSSPPRTQSL